MIDYMIIIVFRNMHNHQLVLLNIRAASIAVALASLFGLLLVLRPTTRAKASNAVRNDGYSRSNGANTKCMVSPKNQIAAALDRFAD
jgi:hypothetical protein